MPQKGFSIASLLNLQNKAEAQGRLGQRKPVAIIDIGSNSVRQVVYEGLTRSPSVLFNEKVACGLGNGVAKTGNLDAEASERAMIAIRRFIMIGKQLNVDETHVIATAAVREAGNGAEFVERVAAVTASPPRILSGREEAQYAAYGIKSGFYRPEGIAGDQGGGSTELIEINGDTSNGTTTPLGGLRLREMSNDDPKLALKIARKTISNHKINWPGEAREFYAIGGTWRSLARLYMLENDYPLDVVHGYRINAADYLAFCHQIVEGSVSQFKNSDEISKARRILLPYGAAVMAELIEQLGIESVSTSMVGLREGLLYSLLDEEVQQRDGLLEATAELSILRARSPLHSQELTEWTDKVFEVLDLEESDGLRRWRHAACNLADIVWRSASDFRAEQTLGIINNAGFNSISHEGRAYLALVSYHRYQGLGAKKKPPAIADLARKTTTRHARILAALFRVVYKFTAAEAGVLPNLDFVRLPTGQLTLMVPGDLADMVGEKPLQRIEHLNRELGEDVQILVP